MISRVQSLRVVMRKTDMEHSKHSYSSSYIVITATVMNFEHENREYFQEQGHQSYG